jgi:hypothetical protein
VVEVAERVLSELRRIERLEAGGADPRELLAAVGELVTSVERWLVEEPQHASAVGPALERCRAALEAPRKVVVAT